MKLPRFTMAVGEQWELPQSRYLADGSAKLGGGTIPKDSFTVELEDEKPSKDKDDSPPPWMPTRG